MVIVFIHDSIIFFTQTFDPNFHLFCLCFCHSKILPFQIINGRCMIYYLWPSEDVKTAFGILLMVIEFFIPFVILIYCYGSIVWMLSRRIYTDMTDINAHQSKTRGINTKINENQKDKNHNRGQQLADLHKHKFQIARRNTIRTLLIVGLCFIICWIQNKILYLMYNCGYDLDWNSTYYHVTVLMVFINSTINPFIYLIMYRDYQVAIQILFQIKAKEQKDNLHSTSSLSTSTPSNFVTV